MGSVIIKASHVGSLSRHGKGYPGPATEEQMELAKRAAVQTKKDGMLKSSSVRKKLFRTRITRQKKSL